MTKKVKCVWATSSTDENGAHVMPSRCKNAGCSGTFDFDKMKPLCDYFRPEEKISRNKQP